MNLDVIVDATQENGKCQETSSTCSVQIMKCFEYLFFLYNIVFCYSAFTMEQDIPDYDMDSDDEKWINSQAEKLSINPLQV